ncbi:MAG TPA: TfoX/Sxy family protein [Acidiferrobacterales bacterium]
MAADPRLTERVRGALARRRGVSEKRMFGGVAFLLNGNMCVGILGERLMVRVGADDYATALRRPHARPMDFTGRPLTGFVYVLPAGIRTTAQLRRWIDAGVDFAKSLGKKTGRAKPRRRT